MGLTQAPTHFSLWSKSVLYGGLDNCPLPIVIYLDNIAMYGDT